MNTMNRATERSKVGRYRAELVFAHHRQEQPRARTVWQAGIDEGNEPLLIDALEGRRMHLRRALLGRHFPEAAPTQLQSPQRTAETRH